MGDTTARYPRQRFVEPYCKCRQVSLSTRRKSMTTIRSGRRSIRRDGRGGEFEKRALSRVVCSGGTPWKTQQRHRPASFSKSAAVSPRRRQSLTHTGPPPNRRRKGGLGGRRRLYDTVTELASLVGHRVARETDSRDPLSRDSRRRVHDDKRTKKK